MAALGFFEIAGMSAAITALDIMLKSADVEFVTCEKRLGGRLVTIIVQGSVSAVETAIDAARLNGITRPVATAVIANPHSETMRMVEASARKYRETPTSNTPLAETPDTETPTSNTPLAETPDKPES